MAGTGPWGCARTQDQLRVRRGCDAEQILHAEPRNHAGLGAGGLNTLSVLRMKKGSHRGGQETKYF